MCLGLLECRPDRCILVGGILHLDYAERQTIHKKYNIRTPQMLPLSDCELVDRQPVIILGIVKVNRACLSPGDRAIIATVLYRNAVYQHAMNSAVTLDE